MFSKSTFKNVFSKVKEDLSHKVQNVKNELNSLVEQAKSPQTMHSAAVGPGGSSIGGGGVGPGVDSSAGMGIDDKTRERLLHSGMGVMREFEERWLGIHNGNVECYEQGYLAVGKFEQLLEDFDEKQKLLEMFYGSTSDLKDTCAVVESLGSSAKFIGFKMNMIEMQMDQLEEHVSKCIEIKKRKRKMKEVEDYKNEKKEELKRLRQECIEKQKLIDQEKLDRELKDLAERRKVYDEAFNEQLEQYKLYGTTQDIVYSKYLKTDSTPGTPQHRRVSDISQLEDVRLDDMGNTEELDDFYKNVEYDEDSEGERDTDASEGEDKKQSISTADLFQSSSEEEEETEQKIVNTQL
eukprot:Nk52_evm69s2039 gene=Nk52_evmTU69s2039